MKKTGLLMLAVVALLAVAGTASAQRMFGSMPRHFLLLNPKVEAELKLTAAQKAAIDKACGDAVSSDDQGRIRIQMTGATDMDEIKVALRKSITPAQDKRLMEIWLQRDGTMTLGDADVQKELGLTPDQKKKIEAIMEEFGDGMQELIHSTGGNITLEASKSLRDGTKKKLDTVMTEAQKAKFETMKGKPFKWN